MERPSMKVNRILETCLYVEDLKKAEEFYSRVLGLELYSRTSGRHVFFRCGNAMFLLFKPERTLQSDSSVPVHGAKGPGHVAFAISIEEYDDWLKRFSDEGVQIETEVVWPGGGKSIYFRDTSGNSIELATPQLWKLT